MGPIWDRQDPGGPHVDPMIFYIWGSISTQFIDCERYSDPFLSPLNRENIYNIILSKYAHGKWWSMILIHMMTWVFALSLKPLSSKYSYVRDWKPYWMPIVWFVIQLIREFDLSELKPISCFESWGVLGYLVYNYNRHDTSRQSPWGYLTQSLEKTDTVGAKRYTHV